MPNPTPFLLTLAGIFLLPINAHATSQNNNAGCEGSVIISFMEGAPVDKFRIENRSDIWQISTVEINLASSKGRLIFDTTPGGKGVDVFQPYKEVSGSAKIISASKIADGSDAVTLRFERFAKGETYTFSIDVDDQLTSSELGQIRISGSEMELAKANFSLIASDGQAKNISASFDKDNKAIVNDPACNT